MTATDPGALAPSTDTQPPAGAAGTPVARRPRGRMDEVADNAGVLGDLVWLIWRKKLWWMVPLLVALLLLAALLLLEATPVGPLLYPLF